LNSDVWTTSLLFESKNYESSEKDGDGHYRQSKEKTTKLQINFRMPLTTKRSIDTSSQLNTKPKSFRKYFKHQKRNMRKENSCSYLS